MRNFSFALGWPVDQVPEGKAAGVLLSHLPNEVGGETAKASISVRADPISAMCESIGVGLVWGSHLLLRCEGEGRLGGEVSLKSFAPGRREPVSVYKFSIKQLEEDFAFSGIVSRAEAAHGKPERRKSFGPDLLVDDGNFVRGHLFLLWVRVRGG
jgi:hypothetical protein